MGNKVAIYDHDTKNAVKWIDKQPESKIGDTPKGRVGVVRRDGTRIGHVGHTAGASVAERLLGRSRGVELKDHDGAPAWVERQDPTAALKGAVTDARHAADLAAAKGSVGKPHKPETHARPRRGG